MSEETSLAIIH